MPSLNATPLSQRTHSPFDDTPTRAPSSGHSSLNPLTSLKPQRTRSLSSLAHPLRPANTNHSHHLDSTTLPDPIDADNTELHRRRVEASFQRQLDSLANAGHALSTSSASSHGHDHPQRRRFDDESHSSRSSSLSSSSSSSALSLGSLRIGLTGSHPAHIAAVAPGPRGGAGVTIEDVDDDDDAVSDSDGHLTYVTERTSVLDSPAKAPAPARTAAAAAPAPSGAGGLFGSPRPSVLSHLHATGALPGPGPGHGLAPSSSSSPRRSPTNENAPPAPSSAARPSASSAAPAAPRAASSPYPSVAPPRTVVPPLSSFARSPFGSSAATKAAAAAASAPRHSSSPLNPALNSPLNASPAASSTVRGGSRVQSPESLLDLHLDEDDDESDADEGRRTGGAADRTARTALPDRTGLTEVLRSPRIVRGEQPRPAVGERRGSPLGSGSGSGKSAEANLVSTALAGLTAKLAALERDNARSATRVAELEARLAREREAAARGPERPSRERERDDEVRAERLRREVEGMLSEERARRAELERVVQSLRAQNAHLDATLSAQHAALASLRTAAAAPAPAPAPAAGSYALRTEVQDLKHALAALGYEVDGVRTVVEELLRDKEARDAQRRWDAEEAERKAALDEVSVGDEGPGTPPETERERSSFVAPSEVERLVREQEEEERRRRHKKATAAAAKPPAPHRASPSLEASHDSTYVPSLSGDSAASRSSASLGSATSATSYATSASASDDLGSAADEPDFARAQRIFEDVSKAASPSRSRRVPPAARRAKTAHAADRVVLLDEPSAHLCTNCHGRKSALRAAAAGGGGGVGGRAEDGTDADAEDLASGEEERARVKRERRRVRTAAAAAAVAAALEEEERRRAKRAEEAKERERERKREKEKRRRAKARDEHRRTLESVLDRLEGDFAAQKKIYLELTAEYQAMSSRADSRKRRVLASHLKASIDVLEDKAREVKRYADALEDLYDAMHEQTCPRRKAHATI